AFRILCQDRNPAITLAGVAVVEGRLFSPEEGWRLCHDAIEVLRRTYNERWPRRLHYLVVLGLERSEEGSTKVCYMCVQFFVPNLAIIVRRYQASNTLGMDEREFWHPLEVC